MKKYIQFIPYIFMILLLIACIFFWNSMQQANKDLEEYKRLHDTEQTSGILNQPLGDIKDREEKVYPKLDKDIELLNRNIRTLDKELTQLEKNKPTKETYNEKFKEMSIDEISKYFSDKYAPVPDSSTGGR